MLCVVKQLDFSAIGIRSKALKAIQEIIPVYPKLLKLPTIIQKVTELLTDQSASIRESAIEFIGKYMFKDEWLDMVYAPLCMRALVGLKW